MANPFLAGFFATYSGIISSALSRAPYGTPSTLRGMLPYRSLICKQIKKPEASVTDLAPIIFGAKPLDQ